MKKFFKWLANLNLSLYTKDIKYSELPEPLYTPRFEPTPEEEIGNFIIENFIRNSVVRSWFDNNKESNTTFLHDTLDSGMKILSYYKDRSMILAYKNIIVFKVYINWYDSVKATGHYNVAFTAPQWLHDGPFKETILCELKQFIAYQQNKDIKNIQDENRKKQIILNGYKPSNLCQTRN